MKKYLRKLQKEIKTVVVILDESPSIENWKRNS